MKCKECGNEEFILIEENGKYNLQLLSYIIPIILIVIGISQLYMPAIWTTIINSMSVTDIKYLGFIIFIAGFISLCTTAITNSNKKHKLRKSEWIKTSRTKATCTKCFKQYYLHSIVEVYTKFPTINTMKQPEDIEKPKIELKENINEYLI